MKITRKHLRKDLPPVLVAKNGTINSVLALCRRNSHPECCSPWCVVNTIFYRKNTEDYIGWIEIEHPGCFANNIVSDPGKKPIE